MRVLIVTSTFLPAWGGAERLIYEVAQRLAEQDEVCVLSPDPPPDARSDHAAELRRSARFDSRSYRSVGRLDQLRGRKFHRGLIPPIDLASFPAVWAATREFRPDAVLAYYGVPTGFAAVLIARLRRIRTVLAYVGRDVPGPGVPPGWRRYTRWLGRRADRTVFISKYCRNELYGEARRKPKSEAIIGGGVSPQMPDEASGQLWRSHHEISEATTVLLCLQRLSDYKGVDVLIRAMPHLANRDCVLFVAGDGRYLPQLERVADELGVSDRVRFLGFVPEEEMATTWAAADIFVFHSFYETFGLAVAEAMAAGVPVVSARSTALVELIDDGESGLLVEPGDHESVAQAVRRFIDEPGLAEDCAQRASQRARSFDWDAIARSYHEALSAPDS